jgi:hypothetical protein
MIDIEHVTAYPQATDTVFAAIADISTYPAWQSDVMSAEIVGGAEVAAGTEIHQVRKVMGRKTDVTLTVADFKPGELLVLRTIDGIGPSVEQTYRILADGTGSTVYFHLHLDGVPRMAEHLAKAQLGKQVPKMFECLGHELQHR